MHVRTRTEDGTAQHEVRVLLVEDDEHDAFVVARTLRQIDGRPNNPPRARTLADAVKQLEGSPADVVLLDLTLPDSQGLDTVRRILAVAPDAAIVVLSGLADHDVALEAVRAGAQDYLHKDRVDAELLARTIAYAVERRRSMGRVQRLNAELEARVQQRTRELARASARLADANRDLEAFAHTATHDLRAPLRSIQGFASMLSDDYGELLDDDGQHMLRRIERACERMNRLLDSLKSLAGVSSASIRPAACDLSAMARSVVDELASGAPDREFELDIEPDLQVVGDPGLLELLLRNLLGNAWKYTRHQSTAHIRFSAEPRENGRLRFVVEDDGAGFDASSGQDPFAPFQRLHGEREFEGDGLGLATARRVVARHGGRIWAESEPGKWSRFHFELSEPDH